MMFLNRTDAGRQLAPLLRRQALRDPIVVGLSHGGVPVAAEIARALGLPLEVCIVRKVIGREGITIGAVAEAGGMFLDTPRITRLGISDADVDALVARERADVERLASLLRDQHVLPVARRDVILVDDGLVSPTVMRAAIHSLRRREVGGVALAVPVADRAVLEQLRPEVDHVTCLSSDDVVVAVGARYQDFSPVSEAEVVDLLAGSRAAASGRAVTAPALSDQLR